MTPRALVVDDDQTMVRTLSDVLRLKGWDVTTAYSGDDAVHAADKDPFDVVLMDVKMPGMDGVDAFKAMKAAHPGIRVVLMTAYAAEDRIAEAQREGVIRILPKPLNVATLLALMASVLDRAQSVLLVDHEVAFLTTMADVLRLRGYEVIVADSVEHARSLLAESRPMAVVLHSHAGSAGARETVAAMRETVASAALILYSGQPNGAEEVSETLPAEWVHAYLQKPFGVEQVLGVLDAIRNRG